MLTVELVDIKGHYSFFYIQCLHLLQSAVHVFPLFCLNGAEHFLENREHLSAIRAFAAVRLDTWKTFAQTVGAKSFSPLDEFLPKYSPPTLPPPST